jgi:O-antigen/teichoic acid export membrane protein
MKTQYSQAKKSPTSAVAFALIALSGFRLAEIEQYNVQITEDAIIVGEKAIPLTKLSRELLSGISIVSAQMVKTGIDALGLHEGRAHEALARALLETSTDAHILQDMVQVDEVLLPLDFVYPFSILERTTPKSESWEDIRSTLEVANARMLLAASQTDGLLSKLLDGRFVFLIVSTGVSGMNMLHNLVMGRFLNPQAYGQLTFFITLLLIVGLIPTAMQTVTARYSSVYVAQGNHDFLARLHRYGVRWGWVMGIALAILLIAIAPIFAEWFQITDTVLFVPIALGIPFFFATGTERGMLQGKNHYYWLSVAYFAEGAIRLFVGIALVFLLMDVGRALDGAVWALTQSLFLTWFIAWLALRTTSSNATTETSASDVTNSHQAISSDNDIVDWQKLFALTAIALLGQALITNSDFILVKTFFDSFDAGLYAAISVIGRIVYFGTLPLTVIVVPIIARKQALGESTKSILLLLMGGGIALCGSLFVASALFAPQILTILYGDAYVTASPLLPIYTIAAALFVLTNLLVTYRVALGRGSETWMPFLAGIVQILGVIIFHETLQQVITVQIATMTILFLGVAWRARR